MVSWTQPFNVSDRASDDPTGEINTAVASEATARNTAISAATFEEVRIHGWRDPAANSAWANSFTSNSGAVYNLSPGGTTPGYLEWSVWMKAGTYRCVVETLVALNIGIGEVLVDGNSFGTFDGYSLVTNTRHAIRLATTRTVTEGLHTIRLAKTGTKNASSSEYFLTVTQILLFEVS